jgi:predicted dehydrogenase
LAPGPETIDWERFLGPAPRRPFEAERVFRWRCYSDYSEGLPGDVLVHLITEIHWLLDLDVPSQVSAAGGILRWKDGDVADTVSALCQYPEGVVLNIGATQANGHDGQLVQLLGTKATLELTHRGWSLYEEHYSEGYPYVIEAWPREFREEFYREHNLPLQPRREPESPPRVLASYESPSGYDSTTEHVRNFLGSIRSRQQPLEDATMGRSSRWKTRRWDTRRQRWHT